MRLRYSAEAISQIRDILSYIRNRDETAAKRVAARLEAAARRITHFQQIGRPGTDPGTREWVLPGLPYILVYEIDEPADEVVIIAVFHSAQDRSA